MQQKHLEINLFFGKVLVLRWGAVVPGGVLSSPVGCCRPIRIQLKEEAAEVAKEETLVIEERISKLEKTAITLEEQNNVVFVSHNVVLTVTDGKFATPSLRRHMLRFGVYVMLHQSR